MRTGLLIALGIIIGSTLSTFIALAWTAPTANPPGANVSSPVNVGNVMQLKNGTLGVNSLGVFGDTILSGSGTDGTPPAYLNFGATAGTNGYGIRNNSGTLEFKNISGSWGSLNTTLTNLMQVNGITSNGIGQITSIKFGDGTTQTTANPWATNGSSIYYNGGNVGIGTQNPASPLTVNGMIQSASGGIKFPDGTVQTTAADTQTLPLFSVNKGGVDQSGVTPVAFVKVTWSNVVADTRGNFNTATSRFTPTVAGYYQLSATVTNAGYPPAYFWNVYIYKDGTYYGANSCEASTGAAMNCTASTLVYANGTTDYFEVYVEQGGTGATMTISGATYGTYFYGYLLAPKF